MIVRTKFNGRCTDRILRGLSPVHTIYFPVHDRFAGLTLQMIRACLRSIFKFRLGFNRRLLVRPSCPEDIPSTGLNDRGTIFDGFPKYVRPYMTVYLVYDTTFVGPRPRAESHSAVCRSSRRSPRSAPPRASREEIDRRAVVVA